MLKNKICIVEIKVKIDNYNSIKEKNTIKIRTK